jgi:hypothetical protein
MEEHFMSVIDIVDPLGGAVRFFEREDVENPEDLKNLCG